MFAVLLCVISLIEPIPTVKDTELKKDQEALWEDLLKDELKATKALLRFSHRPVETASFLKAKLKPLALDQTQLATWLVDLNSEDEKIWKPAFEELDYHDPRLIVDPKDAFDKAMPGKARSRLVAILFGEKPDKFEGLHFTCTADRDNTNFQSDRDGWGVVNRFNREYFEAGCYTKAKWHRVLRCLILLEHIGTTDAIAVLKTMATGQKDAPLTIAAKDALKWLKAE